MGEGQVLGAMRLDNWSTRMIDLHHTRGGWGYVTKMTKYLVEHTTVNACYCIIVFQMGVK